MWVNFDASGSNRSEAGDPEKKKKLKWTLSMGKQTNRRAGILVHSENMEQSAVIAMASWITDSQKHMGAGQIEANGGQKRRSIFLDTTNRR